MWVRRAVWLSCQTSVTFQPAALLLAVAQRKVFVLLGECVDYRRAVAVKVAQLARPEVARAQVLLLLLGPELHLLNNEPHNEGVAHC